MGLSLAPGDLVFVRYLELDGGPSTAYQVIAVYDVEWEGINRHRRFYYFHLGKYRIYDAPVSVLEELSLEVTVHRL